MQITWVRFYSALVQIETNLAIALESLSESQRVWTQKSKKKLERKKSSILYLRCGRLNSRARIILYGHFRSVVNPMLWSRVVMEKNVFSLSRFLTLTVFVIFFSSQFDSELSVIRSFIAFTLITIDSVDAETVVGTVMIVIFAFVWVNTFEAIPNKTLGRLAKLF